MLFQKPKFKKFPAGGMPPRPPWLTRACGTCLTPSVIAYYSGGRARKVIKLTEEYGTQEYKHSYVSLAASLYNLFQTNYIPIQFKLNFPVAYFSRNFAIVSPAIET